MSAILQLKKRLSEIIALEDAQPIETLGGYIVGELLGDYDNTYAELNESNPTVQKIGSLASDIEIANGTPLQLQAMWQEIKDLAIKLDANN
jgi:hypothetical protein